MTARRRRRTWMAFWRWERAASTPKAADSWGCSVFWFSFLLWDFFQGGGGCNVSLMRAAVFYVRGTPTPAQHAREIGDNKRRHRATGSGPSIEQVDPVRRCGGAVPPLAVGGMLPSRLATPLQTDLRCAKSVARPPDYTFCTCARDAGDPL